MNIWAAGTTTELIDAHLREGSAIRFTVPTWSMYPSLAPGDGVIVRGARAAELRLGDIVVVKIGEPLDGTRTAWLAHRLIARRVVDGAVSLVTKGDNCAVADAPWTEAQLCGSVVAVQRQGATQPASLLSRRARWAGMMLALLSRGQWFVRRTFRGLVQRLTLKVSRALFRVGARAARWIVG